MNRAAFLLFLLVGLLAAPAHSAQAQSSGCTEAANVTWETNWEDVTVTGAVVEVRGCQDGTPVGLQLLTDDGDVPAEALVSEVVDEHAHFDLQPLDLRIEPVIGVRVLIYGEPVVEIITIVVEQRLFASSGNEQRGLRQTTPLAIEVGRQYLVPGAPDRYAVVACATVNAVLPDDLVNDALMEGAGTFPAEQPGTHVVCYRQQPGTPGGPPNLEQPRVLEDTEVLAGGSDAYSEGGSEEGLGADLPASPGESLARTGLNVLAVGLVTLVLLSLGRRLTRFGR